jgi:hypothetical protein
MQRNLPPLAWLLGIAGILPFIVCGLETVRLTGLQSNIMLSALLGYGAVILAFLGAVHWGFALAADPAVQERSRLLLGVLPALIGWGALLLALALSQEAGLAALIAGFIVTVGVEHQGRQRGLVPRSYMWMRWTVSLVVVAILVTVLVLRLIGAKIMF